VVTGGSSADGWSDIAYFTRVNYSFKDRYLFQVHLGEKEVQDLDQTIVTGIFQPYQQGGECRKKSLCQKSIG
jgi:hypothetical protein